MTELALRSTSGTEFVEADPGCGIAAVRADGGEVRPPAPPQADR
jgi:hypothetical protein